MRTVWTPSERAPGDNRTKRTPKKGGHGVVTYLRLKRRADRVELAIVISERRAGQPRQRQVAYVGSVRENDRLDVAERSRLWDALDAALDRLGLPPEEDQHIVNMFHHSIPYPEVFVVTTDKERGP